MPTARRLVLVIGAVIVVAIVSLTMVLARAGLGTGPNTLPLQFTPTAFVYEPVMFRNYAPSTPTPTITPTPTTTPTHTPTRIPTHARMYLCCFSLSESCSECWGMYVLDSSSPFKWQSSGLPRDIAGTTYEFGIAASSGGGDTTFQVELFLIQQDQDLLLASTSFTANSAQAERYVRIVQGVDPTVTINEDRLEVRVSVSTRGQIYIGDPDSAEAGGSYVEYPQ